MTGSLEEDVLRKVERALERTGAFEARWRAVVSTVGKAGFLSNALSADLRRASCVEEVEDLYLPYKPGQAATRADAARAAGWGPAAAAMLAGGPRPPGEVSGARDIV